MMVDPFGLTPLILERIETGRGGMQVDWASGYYLSRDHRLMLVLVKPTRPPQDIDFDRELLTEVDRVVAEASDRWPEIVGPDEAAAPTVRIGGSYVSALYDASNIQRDMTINLVTSTTLVLALFLFAFRRWGPLTFAAVPMLCGLTLTFGFAGLTFGVVSSATSGTAALLIGLGIDFVIVSYGRYVEERRKGAELESALATMMGSSGRAVVIGAITTGATFFAFTFTDFRGMRQLGILTGTGILFFMLAVLLLLPAMLAWREDRHERRDSRPRHFLHSFGTESLMRFCLSRPGLILAIGGLVTLLAGAAISRLSFEDSWRSMRPAGSEGVEVERLVARHFNSDFDHMMLVASAPTADEALDAAGRVAAEARSLVDSDVILGVSSAASIVPPPGEQAEALAWLAARRHDGSLDHERIAASFEAALTEEGVRYAPFADGVDLLGRAIGLTRPVTLTDLEHAPQAQRLIDRVMLETDEGWKSVVYLYPPAETWRREAPPEAHQLADDLGDDVILTGANVVNKVMRTRIKRDAWVAALIGTVAVWLLLWLDFRRLRASLLALMPLAVGVVLMLGAMGASGISMNFMNIFVTTMIIGIGVDYGLHMVHRSREVADASEEAWSSGLIETGNAIILAALSTVAGFGSMSLSSYPGLRSTGYVAILGALGTALVATTLLPAYLSLRRRKRLGRPPQK